MLFEVPPDCTIDHAPRNAAGLCGEKQKNTEIRHAMNYDRADTGC